MTQTRFLLVAGVFLGVLGDALMYDSLGVNVSIWTVAFLLFSARATSISAIHSGLALPILFFAGCVAWRESSFLTSCNIIAVLGLTALPHLQHGRVVLRNAFVSDYLRGVRHMLRQLWTGSRAYFTRELPSICATSPLQHHVRSVAIGVGMCIPIVVVFGALFSSADPTFERVFQSVWHLDASSTFRHLTLASVIAAATIGYLRALMQPEPPDTRDGEVTQRMGRFGLTEITIPLVGLVLLSGGFVVLQVPYLFGGQAIVSSTENLSYATYARRGFFELTVATSLVIPVLLCADRLLRQTAANTRVFRIIAAVQITLVAILMTSAMHRMSLYWQQYGLTTTRVYASACMLWVGIVLAWFAMTVLRGHRHRFAFGAMVSGLVTLAALNFANPDHVIARVNIARATVHSPFDAHYLALLSADGYPPILDNLSRIPFAERCSMLATMRVRLDHAPKTWRGWTLSAQKAKSAWVRNVELAPDRC